jgi:hypothetical protein
MPVKYYLECVCFLPCGLVLPSLTSHLAASVFEELAANLMREWVGTSVALSACDIRSHCFSSERGPRSLVRTTEELLEGKVAVPV